MGQVMGMRAHTHTHIHTHIHTHTHTGCKKQHVWERVDAYNHSTPLQGCFLLRAEKMSSYSLHMCSQHVPGQSVCLPLCTIHTYGWPNLSVLLIHKAQSLCLVQSKLLFPSSSSSPSSSSTPLLTCIGKTGLLIFHCLSFGEVTRNTLWSKATPREY